MKFVWETSDIQSARRYGLESSKGEWMLGASAGSTNHRMYHNVDISRGTVSVPYSMTEIIDFLNTNGFVPAEYLKKD